MELRDLVGRHELSGVDTGTMPFKDEWEDTADCEFIKFTLDGVHYLAIEDPDDGYRSRCRELRTSDQPPRFSFPPQAVDCQMEDDDAEYDECNDILVMTDAVTGEVVLRIGTGNYEDYYPYCVFEYNPEGLAINNQDISEDAFKNIIGC